MTESARYSWCVGFVTIGRRRPGFDPAWGEQITTAAWRTCSDRFQAVQPAQPVVDDCTLRAALGELRAAGCQALLVLQPTMGDGRLAPILAQLWEGPLVLWATPERPDADRVSACSLVGTHVFASTLRQMARPFELVYGSPDEPATVQKLADAVRLGVAIERVRHAKLGLVGQHAPGFVNMHADPVAISRLLGTQMQHFGLAEFQAQVEHVETDRIQQDLQAVRHLQLPLAADVTESDLEPNGRYYLAIRDLMEQENLDAIAIRCWPELPSSVGHWPYLAMMRLTEADQAVALEGDVDGALLGLFGKLLGIGPGYISDWLEHDEQRITLWHPGHAPRSCCEPDSLLVGRHFNNDKPVVVNARLRADQDITLARLWRCDGRYHLAAFAARTEAPRRRLLGAHGLALVDGLRVPDRFERLCHAGMPHHVTVFPGHHVALLRRLAERLDVTWLDLE